jgi:hypothetical protein
VVTLCTASLTLTNSSFCPHSVFMCFVWISEQTAIISLYNINWLVFITKAECLLRGTSRDFKNNSVWNTVFIFTLTSFISWDTHTHHTPHTHHIHTHTTYTHTTPQHTHTTYTHTHTTYTHRHTHTTYTLTHTTLTHNTHTHTQYVILIAFPPQQ